MAASIGGTGWAKCEVPQRGCPRRGRLPARGRAANSVQVEGAIADEVHRVHRVVGWEKVCGVAGRCGGAAAQDAL